MPMTPERLTTHEEHVVVGQKSVDMAHHVQCEPARKPFLVRHAFSALLYPASLSSAALHMLRERSHFPFLLLRKHLHDLHTPDTFGIASVFDHLGTNTAVDGRVDQRDARQKAEEEDHSIGHESELHHLALAPYHGRGHKVRVSGVEVGVAEWAIASVAEEICGDLYRRQSLEHRLLSKVYGKGHSHSHQRRRT